MTFRSVIDKITQHEGINFVLTNRIPRRLATSLVGWFSRIEQPMVRDLSIRVWRLFCDLDLSEAKETHFKSLRDCFIRELKDGARPIDADPGELVSPCDAIVGAGGTISGSELLQIKGSAYALEELLLDRDLVEFYRDGSYVTLRLTAAMYHRFHAPHDCVVERVTHIWGDAWNVNPIALKRVAKLFCKNERALIRTRLQATSHLVTLVPVAAILVAGIRLRFADLMVDPRREPQAIPCCTPFRKGDEMGWFEHGSTIIVLAPKGFALCASISTGSTIRMGEPLMRLP
ncbi:MAG TPA: archaetidylserine decarboxylase [Hyphomicrobiaceae bacterium]|nr:archaetidylserine decarboxylase [Hyphomicrobiaceae bacterium]